MIGGLELYGAYVTGGATLEAESALAVTTGALTTSGLVASGTTRITISTAGADSEKTEQAASAIQTVTNPLGLATTVIKQDSKAGSIATDISNTVNAASHPGEAAKDPAGTAMTVGNVVQDLKGILSPPPPPQRPSPPPPPKMCGNNACE